MKTALLELEGRDGSRTGEKLAPAGSALAAFLAARGRRVFEYGGSYWGQYRGMFFSSLPDSVNLAPEPELIHDLHWKFGVRALRVPLNRGPGWPGFLYVCRPHEFDLARLSRQTRSSIRRGEDHFDLRPVGLDQLLAEGLELNRDTMARQGRFDPEFGEPGRWKRFVEALRQCPACHVDGAFSGDRLAAYLVSYREGEWIHALYSFFGREHLPQRVAYALNHWIIRQAAADPGVRAIANSFAGIARNEGLHFFKTSMGYEAVPVTLGIYFHPVAAPVVTNRLAVAGAETLRRIFPNDARLEMGVNLLRGARMTTQNGSPAEAGCQQDDNRVFSRLWRPYPVFIFRRMCQHLKENGAASAFRTIAKGVSSRLRGKPAKPARRPAAPADAVQGFRPGDWVQVKSRDEIAATLDQEGKQAGLAFVPCEMLSHCGGQYRVLKRVEKIFLEESRQNRKLKNTVLLEGVHCQGAGLDCDRACFLFWREAWLKPVFTPAPEGPGQAPAAE